MWNPAGDDGGLGDDGDDDEYDGGNDDGGDDGGGYVMVAVIRNVLKVAQKESSQVDLDSATVLALISAAAFVISRQIDI